MARISIRSLLSIAIVYPMLAWTQDVSPVRVDALIDEALQINPGILSAQRRWLAAQQQEPQVSSLEDPMVSYTRWLSTPETRVGPQENVFMLSQRIPFPGKLGLMGDMAVQDAVAAKARYDAVKRDVVFQVKSAYLDLYWVDRSLLILDDYLTLLDGFTRVAEERYATGEGIQANVLKSQVEISNVIERKLMFERQRQGIVARMNLLLDRPASTPLGTAAIIDTVNVVAPESLLVSKAMADRQELLIARAVNRRSDLMASLARKEYFPNFTLQASYITIPEVQSQFSDAGKDAYSVSIGINLPIQLGRRSSAVEEADAMKQANQMNHRNTENTVKAEISDLYFQAQSTAQTLDLYDKGLILQAESSLESALSAYRTGKLDFLSLLDSERMLLQVRLGYVKEKANYQKALAALERAVGGELPK